MTFAFGYDVSQILRCLDADTAGQLQAGEIVVKSVNEDGAPCEEVIERATFFWNEFAVSYIRGKMFRVGRLKDPANPYKFTEIKDPERRQAYIDAGRKPVEREIDYADKTQPVTLNDTFGFFQMSFVHAYERSNISFTADEARAIIEGKKKRHIMASLPMNEVALPRDRATPPMPDDESCPGHHDESRSCLTSLAGSWGHLVGDGKQTPGAGFLS